MAKPLISDELWAVIEPLLPAPKPRRFRYPGRKPVDNRKALTGIVFVLKTGIPWEALPGDLGVCGMTCWKKLHEWQEAGVWDRLQEVLLKALSLDGNSLMANYVMSQHLHNQIYYLDDSLNSVKEEEKKKILRLRIDQKYEELYRFSKKAFDLYTVNPGPVNKENYKKLISQLVNYYQHKNQPAQAAEYEERLRGL